MAFSAATARRGWCWPRSRCSPSTRARASRRSATGSRATSAAAPATTTSSRRSRPPRRRRGGAMATTTQQGGYVGTPVPRKEDPELLRGQARFVDNLPVPGMVWGYLVRSPYAAARIRGVDVSKALEAEGVIAAFSGADLKED